MPISLRKLTLLFLLLSMTTVASAATLSIAAGSITATGRTEDFVSVGSFDIRASALLDVLNPTSLGFLIVGDFGAAAPNSVLIAANGSSTEFATMTFNTAAPFVSGDLVTLVFGVDVAAVTAITDPALAAIIGSGAIAMTLTDVVPDDVIGVAAGATLVYSATAFTSGSTAIVPEPSTVLMAIGGFAVLALARRFRR